MSERRRITKLQESSAEYQFGMIPDRKSTFMGRNPLMTGNALRGRCRRRNSTPAAQNWRAGAGSGMRVQGETEAGSPCLDLLV
jgi:hypothetical protein